MHHTLEDEGVLDASSDIDLHFVYLPWINHIFRTSYGHHRLRSKGNMSPYQLWIEGMARLDADIHAVDGTVADEDEGTPWDVSRAHSLP